MAVEYQRCCRLTSVRWLRSRSPRTPSWTCLPAVCLSIPPPIAFALGLKRAWVIRAEHSLTVDQEPLKPLGRFGWVACLAAPSGEFVTSRKGMRVIGA